MSFRKASACAFKIPGKDNKQCRLMGFKTGFGQQAISPSVAYLPYTVFAAFIKLYILYKTNTPP
jgi:hypothetical protein